MARSNRWKKSFFVHFHGRIAIGHPICIINMAHVTVIIHHDCRLYCFPVFNAIITFSEWIVNVGQEAHTSAVVIMIHSQCHGLEVLGHALSM